MAEEHMYDALEGTEAYKAKVFDVLNSDQYKVLIEEASDLSKLTKEELIKKLMADAEALTILIKNHMTFFDLISRHYLTNFTQKSEYISIRPLEVDFLRFEEHLEQKLQGILNMSHKVLGNLSFFIKELEKDKKGK